MKVSLAALLLLGKVALANKYLDRAKEQEKKGHIPKGTAAHEASANRHKLKTYDGEECIWEVTDANAGTVN